MNMKIKTLLILTGHTKGLGHAILDRFLSMESVQVVALSRTSLDLDHHHIFQLHVLNFPDEIHEKNQSGGNCSGKIPVRIVRAKQDRNICNQQILDCFECKTQRVRHRYSSAQ